MVQGLAGGNLAAAIAGGAAPYIAYEIGQRIPEDNLAGRLMAHAVVNAALAAVQGKDMAVAAAGAATGELAAKIALDVYNKDVSELKEDEKQTISALATLASALAGGLIGDSSADTVAGAQAGKTTAENNALSDDFQLPKGITDYGMAVRSWGQYVQDNNISREQNQAGLDKLAQGDLPESANIPRVIVDAYKDGVLAAGAAYLGPAASLGKVAVSAVIAGIANGSYQWLDMSSPGNEGKTYDYWSTAAAAATGALAPGRGIWTNTGIAAGSAVFTDGPDAGAVGGAVAGAVAGGYFGEYAPGLLKPALGSSSGIWAEVGGAYTSEILGDATKDTINGAGNNK